MGVKSNQPLFLTWAYVTPQALEEIGALKSKAVIRSKLADELGIDRDDGYPTEILKDLHFNNYAFCKQNGFNAEKTAAFLSIMRLVQEESARARLSVTESFDQVFKPWVLKHGVDRPPVGMGVFSFEDIRLLTDYAMNTFFRHYKLYAYVYVPHRELDLQARPLAVAPSIPWNAQLAPEDEFADPRALPELAYVFKDEQEDRARAMADEMFSQLSARGLGDAEENEVKTIVDRKVSELMSKFETKLQAQDERFKAMIAGDIGYGDEF